MKVAVIGLLPGQREELAQRCPKVKFNFIESKKNGEVRGGGEHCFVMVKFVNHSHTTKCREQFGRERVHLHSGGVSELAAKVLEVAR